MKIVFTFLFLLSSGIFGQSFAQSVFWQDDFENATTPDLGGGTRTPSSNGGTTTSYFKRTNNTAGEISLQALFGTNYASMSGSNIWAGEDHDTPTGNALQTIEWTGINITAKTSMSLLVNLAANNTNGAWDNVNTGSGMVGFGNAGNTALLGNDYMIIEYAKDAAAYASLIQFWGHDILSGGSPTPNKSLDRDTNGDFIGDGTQLTNSLSQFVLSIPGTGTTLKIRISVFSSGSSEEWAADNFRVQGAILPVTWSDYQVNEVSGGVKVSWATASEANSDFFAIERSINGSDYSEISKINAAGNSSSLLQYEFLDAGVAIGTYYYRIRQMDLNGDFSYSEAIEVHIDYPVEFVLYPNPVNESLNITLAKELSSVTIYDYSGSEVAASVRISDEIATIDVSQLPNGMYFAKIEQAGGASEMKRFSIRK